MSFGEQTKHINETVIHLYEHTRSWISKALYWVYLCEPQYKLETWHLKLSIKCFRLTHEISSISGLKYYTAYNNIDNYNTNNNIG